MVMRLHASRRMGIIIFLSLCCMVSWCKLLLWSSPMLLTSLSGNDMYRSTQKTISSPNEISRLAKSSVGGDINCQHVVSPPPRPPRINMTLRRGHLAQNLYHKILKCGPSISNKMRHMHPSMNNTPGILDFTTFLSTDLKILVMGDSVGIQISQTLEEMLGGTPENRKVYRYSWGEREGVHLSAPIRGGGAVAGWRLLGMLLKENLNRNLPNVGPGWRMEDVYNITHHTYNMSNKPGDYKYANGGKQQQQVEIARQISSFDVLLFRIPIGWIKDYDSINNVTLMETVLLAGELFGVETVVFNVPSFTNNILTAQHLQSLRAAQNRVVQFANDFVPSHMATTTNSVQRVLILRMDRLMDETMEWNARLMGMIPNVMTTVATTSTTAATTAASDENDWRLVTVEALNHNRKYIHHVAQTCSALPSTKSPNACMPNYFSRDGMHVCMEKMGGRIFAGLGCVLGCVYDNNNDYIFALPPEECQQYSSTARGNHEKDVVSCANACNDRYLSLTSVDNEVLD